MDIIEGHACGLILHPLVFLMVYFELVWYTISREPLITNNLYISLHPLPTLFVFFLRSPVFSFRVQDLSLFGPD